MTTARLNYNGNDIDFAYGVQKYKTQAVQDMNQQRAASGVMEQININGSQEVDLTLFFDADTKAALESWWWGWARDGGEFAFALDKSKAGYADITGIRGRTYLDYLFHNTDNGFSFTNSTYENFLKFIRQTSTTSWPKLSISGVSVDGEFADRIVAKIRRVSGSGWWGGVQYSTSGHGFSTSYRKIISEPSGIDDDWVVCEWDMSDLTDGGTDYTDNTITGFRIGLGDDATDDVFDIEYIRVRGPNHIDRAYFDSADQAGQFAANDKCILIDTSDSYRQSVEVSSVSTVTIVFTQDLLHEFQASAVLRHLNYYPKLITTDKNFNPQAMSGGDFYTASFKWLEVVD
jgi:hypothetical protein